MNLRFEKYDDRPKEASVDTAVEQPPEQDALDTYEDCALSAKDGEAASAEWEEAAENYEDCAADEALESAEIESLEDDDSEDDDGADDFDDCKKEYAEPYTAEAADSYGSEKTGPCETEENVQEAYGVRGDAAYENEDMLSGLVNEAGNLDSRAKEKFAQLQSMERKSGEYQQALSEYNDLRAQKERITDQIASLQTRQEATDAQAAAEGADDLNPEIDDSSHERLRTQYAAETDPDRKEQIRALDELLTLQETLELTDGDPDTQQMGGMYGAIKGSIDGYEAHHIPPKSVSDTSGNKLPAIYLTKEDHAETSSFRGRMRAKPHPSPFFADVDVTAEAKTYKQRLISQINDGNYADAFRNEVYEIKLKFGDKYDGAIKQAIEANRKYLKSVGNPKVRK